MKFKIFIINIIILFSSIFYSKTSEYLYRNLEVLGGPSFYEDAVGSYFNLTLSQDFNSWSSAVDKDISYITPLENFILGLGVYHDTSRKNIETNNYFEVKSYGFDALFGYLFKSKNKTVHLFLIPYVKCGPSFTVFDTMYTNDSGVWPSLSGGAKAGIVLMEVHNISIGAEYNIVFYKNEIKRFKPYINYSFSF